MYRTDAEIIVVVKKFNGNFKSNGYLNFGVYLFNFIYFIKIYASYY